MLSLCRQTNGQANNSKTICPPHLSMRGQNGASTHSGEQLRQIILKYVHKYRSHGTDNSGQKHTCKLTATYILMLPECKFQMAPLLIKEKNGAKLF